MLFSVNRLLGKTYCRIDIDIDAVWIVFNILKLRWNAVLEIEYLMNMNVTTPFTAHE